MSGINVYNIDRVFLSSLYTNAINEKEIYNSTNQLLCLACSISSTRHMGYSRINVKLVDESSIACNCIFNYRPEKEADIRNIESQILGKIIIISDFSWKRSVYNNNNEVLLWANKFNTYDRKCYDFNEIKFALTKNSFMFSNDIVRLNTSNLINYIESNFQELLTTLKMVNT